MYSIPTGAKSEIQGNPLGFNAELKLQLHITVNVIQYAGHYFITRVSNLLKGHERLA